MEATCSDSFLACAFLPSGACVAVQKFGSLMEESRLLHAALAVRAVKRRSEKAGGSTLLVVRAAAFGAGRSRASGGCAAQTSQRLSQEIFRDLELQAKQPVADSQAAKTALSNGFGFPLA